jgi:hypothetical protein
MKTARWLDLASSATLLVTLILFVVALFEKGLTHDLLLEAGVFLISVKLVLNSHKSELMLRALDEKLDRLR